MFEEIEKEIDERKFELAEKKLEEIVMNEETSKAEVARANYLVGYINSSWLNRARNEEKARLHLLWNIKSQYVNSNSYVLYAQVEKDKTVAINYLKDGLKKFKGDPSIMRELLERVNDDEKEVVIKQIDDEKILDYQLFIKVLEILISKNKWDRVKHYTNLLIKNFNFSIHEKNFFELLDIYSYLFSNEEYEVVTLIDRLKCIIENDLDNKLKYSQYLAMIYIYIKNENLSSANLYFDKISLNNTIDDFYDGIGFDMYVDFSYIYKKIFNEIFNLYKNDLTRKNKAKELYILYLYKPSELISLYRYTKKDMLNLDKIFNSSEFNIYVANVLYEMKLHFSMYVDAYEILIKILLKGRNCESDLLNIYDLFENIDDESLLIIANNMEETLSTSEILLDWNKNLQELISGLIAELYRGKFYEKIVKICNMIDDKILKNLESIFEIAYSYCKMEEKEKALKFYKHILLKQPSNSSVLNNIALIYEDFGYLDEAFECIKKAKDILEDEIHINNYNRINEKLETKIILEKSNEEKKLQDVCKNLSLENLENIGYNIILQKKLNNIDDEELKEILIRDLKECAYSVLLSQNKSAIILSGSIIETLLIYKIKSIGIEEYDLIGLRNRKNKCVKTIDKMILDELLYVANKLQILSDTNYYLSHFSREYRNVIHPNKEIRGKMDISTENASLMWKILKEIIFELL